MQNLRGDKKAGPEAKFANYLQVGHRLFEFYLEFGQAEDQDEDVDPQIHTRIVTTPARAKAFLDALQQSAERYEREFGPIREEE